MFTGDSISKEIFEAIVNSVYEGIIVIDKLERIVLFNSPQSKLLGLARRRP